MKKLKIIIFVNILCLVVGVLAGCRHWKTTNKEENNRDTEVVKESASGVTKEYPTLESGLKNAEECSLCGDMGESIKNTFGGYEDLGIICVNDWNVLNMRIRNHDDSGNLTGAQGYINVTEGVLGEGKHSYYCRPNSDRGISEVTIYGEKDVFDVKRIQNRLCQACLDKVLKVMQVYTSEDKAAQPRDLCIVDFQTLELYSLQGDRSAYFIRDYYVQIEDSREDELSISAIYAPVLE